MPPSDMTDFHIQQCTVEVTYLLRSALIAQGRLSEDAGRSISDAVVVLLHDRVSASTVDFSAATGIEPEALLVSVAADRTTTAGHYRRTLMVADRAVFKSLGSRLRARFSLLGSGSAGRGGQPSGGGTGVGYPVQPRPGRELRPGLGPTAKGDIEDQGAVKLNLPTEADSARKLTDLRGYERSSAVSV
ncbi:MAG: hypothetical protein JWM76_1828 [Pseudonocardiales bacterium]|nr:hypothetical protein [Pseudonocardiales bacterium]